jgi:hypothetical protein
MFLIIAGSLTLLLAGWLVTDSVQNKDPASEVMKEAFTGLFVGFVVSLVACVILLAGNAAFAPYGEKVEASRKTYVLAENTQIKADSGSLEFIYKDESGVPRPYDELVESVRYDGAERKAVEIVKIRHEQGVWIFPWGFSTETTEAVIR